MLEPTDILKCQYCESNFQLAKSYGKKGELKIIKCKCDEYPAIGNLVLPVKDDSQLGKKLISSFAENNDEYKLIWKCLSGANYGIRLAIFAVYFLNKRFQIKIGQKIFFKLIRILSPNKTWFSYLIRREEAPDFKLATSLLSNNIKGLVVDIGCGTGQLMEKIAKKTRGKKIIVGFDKSIISLLIAKIYSKSDDVLFVLTDIEQGIPLRSSMAKAVVLLNSLPWIYNKKRITRESARVLKRGGRIYIFNIFSPINQAKNWGDGISPKNLKAILVANFNKIRVIKYSQENSREIDDYGYNVLAVKK